MSRFKEALDSDEFVVTSELGPPKGCDLTKMKHHIEMLKEHVHAMNITDNQIGRGPYGKIDGW